LVNASIATNQIKATILNDDGLPEQLYSFFVDPLPPLVFSGQNQFVSILARDGYHNRASAFSGTARLQADETIDDLEVGTGTASWEYPVGSFNPSRLQTIYLSNELSGAMSIDSLSLDLTGVFSFFAEDLSGFVVRLKQTTKTNFVTGSNWETNG